MIAAALAARLAATLAPSPAPVPLLTSDCGMGRTTVLLHLQRHLGAQACQYIDVERVASTPEQFLRALVTDSPFHLGPHVTPSAVKSPREAFDACLAFLSSASTPDGRPATFLLDEVLDLRTFESFPGLRTVVADLLEALESSPNRFVLATRFSTRATRLVGSSRRRLELRPLAPLSVADIATMLATTPHRLAPSHSDDEVAKTVHALTDGRPCYVQALLDAMSSMADHGGADPIGALGAALADGGPLSSRCRFSYELRLHRARGYGALKAILQILAEEEALTLTSISQRLCRTPGSTKDYLGWLEDVDLIRVERKRYHVTDPLLRLWIRLQARPTPAGEELIGREVQRYAMLRLAAAARVDVPPPESPVGATSSDAGGRARPSGIVELD